MHVLGVDVGGTNIRMALITPAGDILQQHRQQLDLSRSGRSQAVIIDVLSQCLQPHMDGVSAIGMGFPGFFDGQTGVLAASPNLPALHELNLGEVLEQRLGCNVRVQNDALCAALGEYHFGVAKGHDNLLHITLGTGVGGGLILQGQPLYGEGGMACEFGHLQVEQLDAERCGCGCLGCLETIASASAIARHYQQQSGKQCSAADVYHQACEGDELAMHLFQKAGRALGLAIAQTVKFLDIRHVSISGGLTGAWVLMQPTLQCALSEHLLEPQQGKVQVLLSSLDDQGGILGAASLALGFD